MKWKLRLKGDKLPNGPLTVHIASPDSKSTATPSYDKTPRNTHFPRPKLRKRR